MTALIGSLLCATAISCVPLYSSNPPLLPSSAWPASDHSLCMQQPRTPTSPTGCSAREGGVTSQRGGGEGGVGATETDEEGGRERTGTRMYRVVVCNSIACLGTGRKVTECEGSFSACLLWLEALSGTRWYLQTGR